MTWRVAEPEVNLPVSQTIRVAVDETRVHKVPSEMVTLRELPSTREVGKLVPTMLSLVPPLGLMSVLGVMEVTVRAWTTVEATTSAVPVVSVTTGVQVPATGVAARVQVT